MMKNEKRSSIKLAIVEDEKLFSQLLVKLFEGLDGFRIVLQVKDGRELQHSIREDNLPDVVLMDIAMPHWNGYETTLWLHEFYPTVRVLGVSKHARESNVLRLLACGAMGFLSKDDDMEDLITAVDRVYHSGFYMSPLQPTDGLLNRLPGGKRALKKLTLHEEKFIRLICTDLSYQDIADEMSINLSTAYSYRDALFRKFKVNNRSQMILYCVREGLVFL